jgi:hypothetical protein
MHQVGPTLRELTPETFEGIGNLRAFRAQDRDCKHLRHGISLDRIGEREVIRSTKRLPDGSWGAA